MRSMLVTAFALGVALPAAAVPPPTNPSEIPGEFSLASAIAATSASPDAGASLQCKPDQGVWAGRCFDRYQWDMDEARCPDGVIVMPAGEEQPRCVPCKDVDQQQPMNDCAGLRAGRADKELNATYQELTKDFPDHVSELRTAERAWIKSRDRECRAKEKQYEGGSMASQAYSDCIYRRTRKRNEELKKLRERWSPR
jgi:uncharacterized protein YecT (DUF1311 family)